MSASSKNKWLSKNKLADNLANLDQSLMDAWSDDMTLGKFLDSLPKTERDFFLNMRFGNTPITEENGFSISFTAE